MFARAPRGADVGREHPPDAVELRLRDIDQVAELPDRVPVDGDRRGVGLARGGAARADHLAQSVATEALLDVLRRVQEPLGLHVHSLGILAGPATWCSGGTFIQAMDGAYNGADFETRPRAITASLEGTACARRT